MEWRPATTGLPRMRKSKTPPKSLPVGLVKASSQQLEALLGIVVAGGGRCIGSRGTGTSGTRTPHIWSTTQLSHPLETVDE
eukprot:4867541-Pyramimonas_sp.AAC.1